MTNKNDSLVQRAEAQLFIETPQVEPAEELGEIHVRVDAPQAGTARCVVLSANNPWLPLLAQDPTRASAVILAVDNDVYICQSRDIAMQIAGSANGTDGFYLPAGIGIPVDNQGPYWVACTTTATSSRVSVIISRVET